MTWAEWQSVLKRIAARWGRLGVVSEETAREWFTELRDLPADAIEAAFLSFFRAGEVGPPHAGRIRNRVLELDAITQRRPLVTVGRTEEAAAAWAAALPSIEHALDAHEYRIWIEPLRPLAIDEGVLYVEAPRESCEWVRRRFAAVLSAAAVRAVEGITRMEVLKAEKEQAA